MATRAFKVKQGLLVGTSTTEIGSILDEDNFASDSATALATQQSIKAYVDSTASAAGTLTVIDDGEGERNTATQTLRDQFRQWLNGAVIAGSGDSKLIFIGTIVDEESTNGIFINGELKSESNLQSGFRIQIGKFNLIVTKVEKK